MKLSEAIHIRSRFSRSVNLERDSSVSALTGYVPTGRALDVVRRLAQGMLDAPSGRALSITGPHGGGKSSLAIFIDGLTSPSSSEINKSAIKLLEEFDPILKKLWSDGVSSLPLSGKGFVRAIATATREPISKSLIRALDRAVIRDLGKKPEMREAVEGLSKNKETRDRQFLDLVAEIAKKQPIIFIIDEFGKNLESYADSPAEADPFILQALSELAQGDNALPIFIMTMQHLSFDEYVQGTTGNQRREWAKIQGRFQDIPFVDSPIQSRKLISSVFDQKSSTLKTAYSGWLKAHEKELTIAGLAEIAFNVDTLNSYPLHPLTLSVLPQLCSRYGQNERTLFSFLASKEPKSVASFLNQTIWDKNLSLPLIGLDLVYDYFLESAPTMLSASNTANRWIEIESRIRDIHGLTEEEEKILKTIGLLNLVTSGGTLRASKNILLLSLSGTKESAKIIERRLDKSLAKLEARGLVIFRSFADEFRVWQGSDFDLRAATENARRALQGKSLARILNEVVQLAPMVAGRHSQVKGILRIFEQKFYDPAIEDLLPPVSESHFDGVVGYSVLPLRIEELKPLPKNSKPIVIFNPKDLTKLSDLAFETSALYSVLHEENLKTLDWVAKRELVERFIVVKQQMLELVNLTWFTEADWVACSSNSYRLDKAKGISSALSDVCDATYKKSPIVKSEMIARRELTGQGTRACRNVIEGMLKNLSKPAFGIEGFGPDRAIYQAIFAATGLHHKNDAGKWVIGQPDKLSWGPVWKEVEGAFESATSARLPISTIASLLTRPPFGLKDGLIPLLLFCAIVSKGSDIALYEHGTLVLNLDDAVAERFAKNPSNFAIRNYATSEGARAKCISGIVKAFAIENVPVENSFLAVVRALYRELYFLTPFSKQTLKYLTKESKLVRQAFQGALEPDILFFEDIPKILGLQPIFPESHITSQQVARYSSELLNIFKNFKNSYQNLMDDVAHEIAESTATSSDVNKMRQQLVGQATNLEGRVLERGLNSFVTAILRENLTTNDWLENMAMVVADGSPTKSWNDESLGKFSHKASELGGSLRRLQALLYDRLSKDEAAFDAIRITVTHPDGKENVQILSITEAETKLVSEELFSVLRTLEGKMGSSSAARGALFAWLASKNEEETTLTLRDRDGKKHG